MLKHLADEKHRKMYEKKIHRRAMNCRKKIQVGEKFFYNKKAHNGNFFLGLLLVHD